MEDEEFVEKSKILLEFRKELSKKGIELPVSEDMNQSIKETFEKLKPEFIEFKFSFYCSDALLNLISSVKMLSIVHNTLLDDIYIFQKEFQKYYDSAIELILIGREKFKNDYKYWNIKILNYLKSKSKIIPLHSEDFELWYLCYCEIVLNMNMIETSKREIMSHDFELYHKYHVIMIEKEITYYNAFLKLKMPINEVSYPATAAFCKMVERSGLMILGKSKGKFCKAVCEKYGLIYSENVRQDFSNEPSENNINEVKLKILPYIIENDSKILNSVNLYA